MKKTLLLMTLLTGCATARSQPDCDCAGFGKLQAEKRTDPSFNIRAAAASLQQMTEAACLPRYYEMLAEALMIERDPDSAESYLQKAVVWYQTNKCPVAAYRNYYHQRAILQNNRGNYTQSLELSFKELEQLESGGDKYDKARCLLLIATSFDRMKQSVKGIEYTRRVIPIVEEVDSPLEKGSLLFDLGVRYLWRYQDTKNKAFLDSAEQFMKKELIIAREHNFVSLLLKGFNKMNGLAHERKDYNTALLYIDSSLALSERTGDLAQRATSFGDRADVFMEQEKYAEARRYADSCLALHQLTGNPETIANAYALIYEISNRSENYKDAVWAMNEYINITDSLTNAEKSKQINELEKKYNQAKNEKTIRELDQQKRIYLLLALAGLLTAIAIAFFLRQQSLKHKKNILETEQRLNRARMNPHFFFNALTALQKAALTANDGQAIASNLSRFSHIMRETLENTYKEYVTIEQEMEFLTEYLEVQKIRLPQSFGYEIQAGKELEIDDLLIPSMILQPFVENSIEHGFAGVDHPGFVSIRFEMAGQELLIRIMDNGKGLGGGAVAAGSGHISRASQIIKDRIYLLNIKLKTKAGFRIDNNPDGNGVLVQIHLPILYKDQIKGYV